MNNQSNGMGTGKAILITLAILSCIGWLINLGTPKCIKSGCRNDAVDGSSYCSLHDTYRDTHSNYKSTYSTYSNDSNKSTKTKDSSASYSSGSSTSSGSQNRYSSGSSSGKKNKYYHNTYDDGYEDVYENGDYDSDRYSRDDDYASGVDDAIGDMEDEGEEW